MGAISPEACKNEVGGSIQSKPATGQRIGGRIRSVRYALAARGRGLIKTERGATLVVVSLCLMPLIIMVALVIDLGQKRQLEAAAQGSIDAAALASTYDVRYIHPGDLDHAATVAKDKVQQGFNIARSAWDSCEDPHHLQNLPPGHAGSCVSFEQRSDATGQLAWFVKIRLPNYKYSTLFAKAFGRDTLVVESFGGADGGVGETAPTFASTSTTLSPEQLCNNQIVNDYSGDANNLAQQMIDAWVAAHPGEPLVAQWWDYTDMNNPMPIAAVPPYVPPAECGPTTQANLDFWSSLWQWNWGAYWYNLCIAHYLLEVGYDYSKLQVGVCITPGVMPTGYVPPSQTTTTTGAAVSTTSKPITLG